MVVRVQHSPARFLVALVTLAASCCIGGCGGEAARGRETRLLVVGWDGATFDLIDPLIEAGRLPNLARLARAGRTAWLESTKVPISSAAWTGAATGHGPGETGIYDFFERDDDSLGIHIIDSRANRRPPIWRILSGRGLHVNVWGVPITWPPEPVTGTMVAGMLSPSAADYAWPAPYSSVLRDRGFIPDIGVWTALRKMTPERMREQLAIKEQAVLELLSRPDWDFSMVVFKALDVASHYLYDGRPDTVVAQLLMDLDRILGLMLEAAGPDTDLLLVSDHGFGIYPFSFNISSWLLETGYSVESGVSEGALPKATPIVDYQPELDRRRLEALDLTRTRALATNTECEGNFGSLRLQVAGRDPGGIVSPADFEALLAEIEAELQAFSPGGRPLVTRTWRGSELYPGPAREAIPDLIFEIVPDHMVLANATDGILTKYDRPRPEHRLDGIFVASGPSIAQAFERERFQVFDIAPIALHLLEQPFYEEMTGDPRAHLLAEPRPVIRIKQADDHDLPSRDAAWDPPELTAEERAAQERLLRALGYAEGEDDEDDG
ncbi:MAG TPA: alkaline phosphatase family protein [Planctomycetota bacterium]|nr:alkaline phosphatase family protein [Planctomycetota bacterium]